MKKLILTLTMLFTLALSATAFAATPDYGAMLNGQITTANKVLDVLSKNQDAATLEPLFMEEVRKDNITAKLKDVQKNMNEKFGTLKASNIIGWDILESDNKPFYRVIYILEFSKEKVVRYDIITDSNGKIANFGLNALEEKTEKDSTKTKK